MKILTPHDYLRILDEQNAIIEAATEKIDAARKAANKCPPPKNRRPACAKDIQPGAVIWHERDQRWGGDYWHVVEELLHYGDPWKAYTADDGCRYGLDGAYVEEET